MKKGEDVLLREEGDLRQSEEQGGLERRALEHFKLTLRSFVIIKQCHASSFSLSIIGFEFTVHCGDSC
jgi:hypothetical protein